MNRAPPPDATPNASSKKRVLRGRGFEASNVPNEGSFTRRTKSDCYDVKEQVNSANNHKSEFQSSRKQRSQKSGDRDKVNSSAKKKIFATPTGNHCSSNGIQSSTATFRFDDFISVSEAERRIQLGEFMYGVLRVNAMFYDEAFIASSLNDSDVLVYGVAARNRALNGDCVAVRIEPIRNWRVMRVSDDLTSKLKDMIAHQQADDGNNRRARKQERNWFTLGEVCAVDEGYARTLLGDSSLEDVMIEELLERDNLANVDFQRLQRTGRVVSILNPVAPRVAVGFLTIPEIYKARFTDADAVSTLPIDSDVYAVLSPRDTRMPRLRVVLRDLLDEHASNHVVQNGDDMLYYARIDDWPIDSPMPFGKIVRYLGSVGDVAVRNAAILLENGVDYEDQFEDSLVTPLRRFFASSDHGQTNGAVAATTTTKPKSKANVILQQFASQQPPVPVTGANRGETEDQLEVKVTQKDLESRKEFDFRTEPALCTIDPETARDLDDAVHCRLLSSTVDQESYEVGVHIADVSHFINEHSALDEEARKRATTVYLAERAIHMLPHELSQQLASLAPGRDRLTFSVIWQINVKKNVDGSEALSIDSQRFGKSVINSCAQLSYEDAQALLSDDTSVERVERITAKLKHGDLDTLKTSLRYLNRITKILNANRLEDGALRINNSKLLFRIDPESKLPTECCVIPRIDSHRLIEELMLLANTSVAQLLYKGSPAYALLRRHPKPTARQLANLATQCSNFGLPLCVPIAPDSTSADLQRALNGLEAALRQNSAVITNVVPDSTTDDQTAIFRVFLNVCSKVLPLASYYCAGYLEESIWSSDHYALAMQHYCHFTSPIRRFADVMVHRQLAALIEQQKGAANAKNKEMKPTLRWHNEQAAAIIEFQRQAEVCNQRKRSARDIQDSQAALYLGVFIKSFGPLRNEQCYVIAPHDQSIDLYITRFGVIKRCQREHQTDVLKWLLRPANVVQVDAQDLDTSNRSNHNQDDAEKLAQKLANVSVCDSSVACNEEQSDADSDDGADLNCTVTENMNRPAMELALVWRTDDCPAHGPKASNSTPKANQTEAKVASDRCCKCVGQSLRLLQPIKCTLISRSHMTESKQKSRKKKNQKANNSTKTQQQDPFDWIVLIEH